MKKSTFLYLFPLFWLLPAGSFAQSVAGFWLGVTYPANPNQAVYNYTMSVTQTGTAIGGTAQTANPDVPFGGVAYLAGQFTNPIFQFRESDDKGRTNTPDVCYWTGNLTYNPVDESLTGRYREIPNPNSPGCATSSGGTVELYRIVLKSGTKYCKGSPTNLVVTGKNIRWYSSASKASLLATGNTFSPTLTQTTTFYITQTLYRNESPTVPITIEVVEATFKATATNAACGKADGVIAVETAGAAGWQYSLNGGAYQSTPSFANLSPGTYKIAVKDPAGCTAEQSVTVATSSGPAIGDLQLTPPRCGTANGAVRIVATGGTAPLTYSLDGKTFQPNSLFSDLPGGALTAFVRDAKGCEVSRAGNLPSPKLLTVLSSDAKATTCGRPNGQATFVVAGGTKPVQYRVDGQSFQAVNTFDGLKAGTYTLTARDSAGCTVSQSVSVAASTGPEIADVRITPEGCGQKNGAVTIATINASAEADYSLDGRAFQRSSAFAGLSAGTYTLTLKDATNCVVTQTIVIPLDCANTVQLPSAFSPNADSRNDALTAHFTFPSLSVARLTVYNRWGIVVYGRADFTITSGEPLWDGKIGGQVGAVGTYSCQIEFQFPNGVQHTYRKAVELLH